MLLHEPSFLLVTISSPPIGLHLQEVISRITGSQRVHGFVKNNGILHLLKTSTRIGIIMNTISYSKIFLSLIFEFEWRTSQK